MRKSIPPLVLVIFLCQVLCPGILFAQPHQYFIEPFTLAPNSSTKQTKALVLLAKKANVEKAIEILAKELKKYHEISAQEFEKIRYELYAEIRRFLIKEGDNYSFSLGIGVGNSSRKGDKYMSVSFIDSKGKVYHDKSVEMGLYKMPPEISELIENLPSSDDFKDVTSTFLPLQIKADIEKAIEILAKELKKYHEISAQEFEKIRYELYAEIRRFLIREGDNYSFSLGVGKSSRKGDKYMSVSFIDSKGNLYHDRSVEMGLYKMPPEISELIERIDAARNLVEKSKFKPVILHPKSA